MTENEANIIRVLEENRRYREKIKGFGRRLSAMLVTEEAAEHGRVLIVQQRE